MKSIHIVPKVRNAVVVDHSTNVVKRLEPLRFDIDSIYTAPEDMQVCYTNNNNQHITLEAKKGDIIITFYNYDYIVNNVIVVKNNKWKENLINQQCDIDNRQNRSVKFSELSDTHVVCKDCEDC